MVSASKMYKKNTALHIPFMFLMVVYVNLSKEKKRKKKIMSMK